MIQRQYSDHDHTDTYEVPLPPEAFGARQLIDHLFHPRGTPGLPTSSLSPAGVPLHPIPDHMGMPLQLATESVNPETNRRLVYFGSGCPPIAVVAEPRNRFVSIAFRSGSQTKDANNYVTLFGTVMGYSDDNREFIWHERSDRFATRVPLESVYMIHRAPCKQCTHCGLVCLDQEQQAHSRSHQKGSGMHWGTFNNDTELGCIAGDSGLVQSLERSLPLSEGAQGVVSLCKLRQPDAHDAAVHPEWYAYRFVCTHRSTQRDPMTQAVSKNMHHNTDADALAQYQKSVRFMTVLCHPHLVEYLAVQLLPSKRDVRIIMPFYDEGDVAKYIKEASRKVDERFICSIALQLSDALSFLHDRNPPIVHGDIKPENVMFYNNKEQVILMDLDASHELRDGDQMGVRSSVGTFEYMAPETQNNERLLPASDIWSLGVVLYVLTVLPDFPMIIHPVTMDPTPFSSPSWATPEDQEAIVEYLRVNTTSSSTARQSPLYRAADMSSRSRRGGSITLSECVREAVSRKGYSSDLTNLIVDLLSYNPFKRPRAHTVVERLTEMLAKDLLR